MMEVSDRSGDGWTARPKKEKSGRMGRMQRTGARERRGWDEPS